MNQPSPSWWISFVDPKPDRFLGACIVTGTDFVDAAKRAGKLGCNPGGAAQGHEIPADTAPFIEDRWRRRLLSKPEVEELDEHIQSVCSAAARRAQEPVGDT